jgi:predicted transcriptional regulator
MSMTLRLDDEQDAELTALAASQGISKNEAALRAIRESADRLNSDADVRRLTRAGIERYGPLLDRLAQ